MTSHACACPSYLLSNYMLSPLLIHEQFSFWVQRIDQKIFLKLFDMTNNLCKEKMLVVMLNKNINVFEGNFDKEMKPKLYLILLKMMEKITMQQAMLKM